MSHPPGSPLPSEGEQHRCQENVLRLPAAEQPAGVVPALSCPLLGPWVPFGVPVGFGVDCAKLGKIVKHLQLGVMLLLIGVQAEIIQRMCCS